MLRNRPVDAENDGLRLSRQIHPLFAFDQGEGLSEHTAPFDALVQVLEGVAEITISGNRFSVKSGESIIMPANKPHALRATEKFKMLLTMIRL